MHVCMYVCVYVCKDPIYVYVCTAARSPVIFHALHAGSVTPAATLQSLESENAARQLRQAEKQKQSMD